jgi:hypothetical protein
MVVVSQSTPLRSDGWNRQIADLDTLSVLQAFDCIMDLFCHMVVLADLH